ncbi:hypothetical protein Q0N12_16415 [Rossellomorea marisflavi]|uniref:hypothetical protein n=1 Tax=Rossellomorea marisflavi TaxID=189381 RepID=UPI00345AC05E
MIQYDGFNAKTHIFKEFVVTHKHYMRYNKYFNSAEDAHEYINSSEFLHLYHMDYMSGGKVNTVIDERKPIVFFYNENSRRYFVENNTEYDVLEEVTYQGRLAVWVKPKSED